jgi:hypothetical protein
VSSIVATNNCDSLFSTLHHKISVRVPFRNNGESILLNTYHLCPLAVADSSEHPSRSVVLDFSFWERSERARWRAMAAAAPGVRRVLTFWLDCPAAECRRRLALRNRHLDRAAVGTFHIPLDAFDAWVDYFEAPRSLTHAAASDQQHGAGNHSSAHKVEHAAFDEPDVHAVGCDIDAFNLTAALL